MAVSFDLTGRTAVVVGGTTGIGRALALGLADAGADVVATGRRANIVEEVASAIESRGRRTLRVASDVADAVSLQRLRDACVAGFGQVDIVVAAAGVTRRVATSAALTSSSPSRSGSRRPGQRRTPGRRTCRPTRGRR